MKSIIAEFLVALVDLIFRFLQIYKTIREKGVDLIAKVRKR